MTSHSLVVLITWCAVTFVGLPFSHGEILFDFEDGTQGWETEGLSLPAELVESLARSGQRALAFTHTFSPSARILHCRSREGFPKDFSSDDFLGFSAWIYIPVKAGAWEAKMFVRTGEKWNVCSGKSRKNLLPGWHRLMLTREEIDDLRSIQDIGVQVILASSETVKARILIDQVEVLRRH